MTTRYTSEPTGEPRLIPEALAAGLDIFAAAWLEEWARHGGSTFVHSDGTQIGYPANDPGYREPASDLTEWQRSNRLTFAEGQYSGKMRALIDLLSAVPFGREAINDHMRSHAMASYYGQSGERA